MDKKRWVELEKSLDSVISIEESEEGWHWCPDWDYLLVGPGMGELESCCCGAQPILRAKELTNGLLNEETFEEILDLEWDRDIFPGACDKE